MCLAEQKMELPVGVKTFSSYGKKQDVRLRTRNVCGQARIVQLST